MYNQIIKELVVFEEDFHTKSFNWSCDNQNITTFEQLDNFWSNQENLKSVHSFIFHYTMHGFKKAGTEHYGESLQLIFHIDTYFYGFSIINYNNHQPFIKKLYHQPITAEDRQMIVDLLMTTVLDRIDWIIERIKK